MTWASWVDFVLGLWLIIAPFVLGYRALSGTATWNDVLLGVLIAVFSLWTALKFSVPAAAKWLLIIFGLWVLIAPFVLHTRVIARVTPNDVIVGLAVLILAIVRMSIGRRPEATTQTT